MLMQAVNTYLAIRRAMGFALDHTEGYLRNFARFALARGDTHIVAATAVDWASRTTSEAQRRTRLHTVLRFARFMAAEDARHEINNVTTIGNKHYTDLNFCAAEQRHGRNCSVGGGNNTTPEGFFGFRERLAARSADLLDNILT